MGERSRNEVARRAGVNPGYVDRLVELGILRRGQDDAFPQGDVLRARWVHGLEAAGVPLEGMAAAIRDGTLSFSTGQTTVTFEAGRPVYISDC